MAEARQAELPLGGARVYTVSEVNEEAKDFLEKSFPRIQVQGEISNYILHRSGHRYFDLKDEGATIRCTFFAGRARSLRVTLENGQQVVCTGSLSIYTARGQFQLLVESVEMGGLGLLFQKLEALKKRMQEEGLFDEDRKRPLPAFPRRVGVVTSPEGAAIRDILKILRKRAPQISVLIYPVHVQGEGAAAEIAEAIRWMGAAGGCDLIIAGRGGGSIEDLWAFNEEIVARAIAACPLPVISAVGHEKDWLLTDLVADARAPTPSGAAEMIAKSREEIGERIGKLLVQMSSSLARSIAFRRERLYRVRESAAFRRLPSSINQLIQRVESLRGAATEAMRRRIETGRRRVGIATLGVERGSPRAVLERRGEMVRSLRVQLPVLMRRSLEFRGHRIARAVSLLNALGPYKVLERGYSICYRDGRTGVVKDASTVALGENLEVQLHAGSIHVVAKRAP